MTFQCESCGCEWDSQIENSDKVNASLKSCPMCVEGEEEEGDEDDEEEDSEPEIPLSKIRHSAGRNKYSEKFLDFCRNNIDKYTNQELVDAAVNKFHIDTNITQLPPVLNYRGIKRSKVKVESSGWQEGIHFDEGDGKYSCNKHVNTSDHKISSDVDEVNCKNCLIRLNKNKEKPKEEPEEDAGPQKVLSRDMESEIKLFMKENRGMSDKKLTEVIEEKFGVKIKTKKVKLMRHEARARYKYDRDMQDDYLPDSSDDEVDDMLEG